MSITKKQIDNAKQCAAFIKALIHITPKPEFQTRRTAVFDKLVNAGFNHVGGGYYSVVVSHDSCPDLVFKLCLHENADKESGITYLAWARANPGPHVPKVFHLERMTGAYISVINKLSPMDCDNQEFFMNHMDQYAMNPYRDDYDVCRVALQIKEFFSGICGWDLHSDNVMQDEDGNLVITDPITCTEDNESRLLRDGMERAFSVEKSA